MRNPALSRTLLAQLNLALLGGRGGYELRDLAEAEARDAGLTGAEIDAAWAGRSFDVLVGAAIDFACAVRSFSPVAIGFCRQKARKVGLTDLELDLIEAEALRLAMREISMEARSASLRTVLAH